MPITSYPSPVDPTVSLPCLSILGQPPEQVGATDKHVTDTIISGESADQPPVLIMVGLDDRGKPHASWFAAPEQQQAHHAAELMGLALIAAKGTDLAAVAASLPRGKLFESGKAFVPFVKRSVYDQLATYLNEDYFKAAALRIEASAADYAKASKGEAEVEARKPRDWQSITAGDLVLASDGPSDGWYECLVLEVRDGGDFVLRWRDWPEVEPFTRELRAIGLLHPEYAEK